ncbi:5293_t:CDS:1, partial [Racocetra persica]
ENPKYKKKTKKQLAEELKPKSTIINLEKFRTKEQEPMIMYFEPYGLPVYNLAGKKNGLEA